MNSDFTKVAIGIAGYRLVSHKWYAPMLQQVADFHKHGLELVRPITVGSMATDLSRNHVVEEFLKTDAEFLAWVDDDNVGDTGAIARLIQLRREMATGVYVKRNDEKEPIIYIGHGNDYAVIDNYTTGEILPVDSAGLGGCVIHRSVFEKINEEFVPVKFSMGGSTLVHRDDIRGDVLDEAKDPDDGLVIDGVLQARVKMNYDYSVFPYHMSMFGRTEDYFFFENAKRVGYQLWVDTATVIGHIGEVVYKPELRFGSE